MSDSNYTPDEKPGPLLSPGALEWIKNYRARFIQDPADGDSGVSPKGAAAPRQPSWELSSLSTVHIRPKIEYRAGAGVLKAVRGHVKVDAANDEDRPKVGGIRGDIKTFSFASRRRMQRELAGVRRDAELPCFVTLTYPNSFPSAERSKRDLKVFNQRIRRVYSSVGECWKLEPQERGAPHFHLMVWNVDELDLFGWVVDNWHDIAGGGDEYHRLWHLGLLGGKNKPCVSKVEDYDHMQRYATKYMEKTFEVSGWTEQWTGRYWGFIGKRNIPFGEWVKLDLSERDVSTVMRYQRRFAGIKARPGRTLTILCDADQWVKNLTRKEVATRDNLDVQFDGLES